MTSKANKHPEIVFGARLILSTGALVGTVIVFIFTTFKTENVANAEHIQITKRVDKLEDMQRTVDQNQELLKEVLRVVK